MTVILQSRFFKKKGFCYSFQVQKCADMNGTGSCGIRSGSSVDAMQKNNKMLSQRSLLTSLYHLLLIFFFNFGEVVEYGRGRITLSRQDIDNVMLSCFQNAYNDAVSYRLMIRWASGSTNSLIGCHEGIGASSSISVTHLKKTSFEKCSITPLRGNLFSQRIGIISQTLASMLVIYLNTNVYPACNNCVCPTRTQPPT